MLAPILCPQCHTALLPQGNDASARTICPGCAHHFVIDDGVAAPPPELAIHEWQTEGELKRERLSTQHRQQLGWLIKFGIGIAIVAGLLLWRLHLSSHGGALAEVAGAEPTPEKSQLQAAYASAKAALEAPDWEHMLPHVRAAQRVRPLLEWYYAHHPQGFTSRVVTGVDQEIIDLALPLPTATLRLLTTTGVRHVLLEQTPEGWRMDWESYSNVYATLWTALLAGQSVPPGIAWPMEIEACPQSVLVPSWFEETGLPREDVGRAVRLHLGSPQPVAGACFTAADPVGQTILAALPNSQVALHWVVKLHILNTTTYPPAVAITEIVAQQWPNPPLPHPRG